MIVLDASDWIGTIFPDEPHHATSRAWLDDRLASGDGISMPNLFLAEIAGAIVRRSPDAAEAKRNVGIVRSGALFTVVTTDPLIELIVETAVAGSLRGADTVYVALARRLKVPLVTWDSETGRKAGHLIDVHEPTVIAA